MPILIIARLTLHEAVRRRLLVAVAVLTVLIVVLTGWGFSRLQSIQCGGKPCGQVEIRFVASQLVILLSFMFSFVIALGAAFMAAPAIASDIESGLALAILPRPIRRSDVVLGKWLGLSAALLTYVIIAAVAELTVVKLTVDYLPPHLVKTVLFIAGEAIVLLTLSLLGSTRLSPMTGGIIAVVLYGIAWMGGIAGSIGAAFNYRAFVHTSTLISLILPTDALWRGAIYNLEPESVLLTVRQAGRGADTNPFFASAPPPAAFVIWAIAWVIVVLLLAVNSFQRREL